MEDRIQSEDWIILLLYAAMVVATIFFIPRIDLTERERYAYLGTVVNEMRDVDVVDSVTHDYATYTYYVIYEDENGRTCVHKTESDHKDYKIKVDGKSYLYKCATRLNKNQYIALYCIIMLALVFFLFCCYSEDGRMLRLFAAFIFLFVKEEKPQLKNDNNDKSYIV